MPKAKYESIYLQIRKDITDGKYEFGDYLPSENEYAERFDCTRNTVRRALSILTGEGYLQPRHGRGVQVIYQKEQERSLFTVGGIESFAETVRRNHRKAETKVLAFREIEADKAISRRTGFEPGAKLYYIERLRLMDGIAVIRDTNMYLKSEAPGLTPEIASRSIYRYLEDELHMTITTSRRRVTAEKPTPEDLACMDLSEYPFVLVVSGQVFNSNGVLFEYTQSRHRPDLVCFAETAVRQKL